MLPRPLPQNDPYFVAVYSDVEWCREYAIEVSVRVRPYYFFMFYLYQCLLDGIVSMGC